MDAVAAQDLSGRARKARSGDSRGAARTRRLGLGGPVLAAVQVLEPRLLLAVTATWAAYGTASGSLGSAEYDEPGPGYVPSLSSFPPEGSTGGTSFAESGYASSEGDTIESWVRGSATATKAREAWYTYKLSVRATAQGGTTIPSWMGGGFPEWGVVLQVVLKVTEKKAWVGWLNDPWRVTVDGSYVSRSFGLPYSFSYGRELDVGEHVVEVRSSASWSGDDFNEYLDLYIPTEQPELGGAFGPVTPSTVGEERGTSTFRLRNLGEGLALGWLKTEFYVRNLQTRVEWPLPELAQNTWIDIPPGGSGEEVPLTFWVPGAAPAGAYELVARVDTVGAHGPTKEVVGPQLYVWWPPPPPTFPSLSGFSDAATVDQVAVTYESWSPMNPFHVQFYRSADATPDPAEDVPVGSAISVSEQAVAAREGDLALTTTSGASLLPSSALEAGERRLVLRPAAFGLDAALLDPSAELVYAVLEETGEVVCFRGFYQSAAGAAMAVRAGAGTPDVVDVSDGGALVVMNGRNQATRGAARLLVVTSSGNDQLTVAPDAPIPVDARLGDGTDWAWGGAGADTLRGGGGTDFLFGEGFSTTVEPMQALADDLRANHRLTLTATMAPQPGAADLIRGDGGFDVLVGGAGADDLFADADGGVILGDYPALGGVLTVDLDLLFAGLVLGASPVAFTEPTRQLLARAIDLDVSLATGVGGADRLYGGTSGFTLGFGAGGNDTFASSGGDFDAFFGNAGADTFDGGSAKIAFADGGAGRDTLAGGTWGSALLGGAGDDSLTGGDGLVAEVLWGDGYQVSSTGIPEFLKGLLEYSVRFVVKLVPIAGGNDTIRGRDGFDAILGGQGDDFIDGGSGVGILLGDDVSAEAGYEIDLTKALKPDSDSTAAAKEVKANGLLQQAFNLLGPTAKVEFSGEGRDTILGGDREELIFGGGGNDSIAAGGGYMDALWGGDGDDTVESNASVSFMAGGAGDDRLTANNLVGSLMLGDDFRSAGTNLANLFPKFEIGFKDDPTGGWRLVSKVSWEAGFFAVGNGNDTLSADSGVNFMIGGDGDDQLTGGVGGLNFIMGDSVNAGVRFSIDFSLVTDIVWDWALGKPIADDRFKALSDELRLPGLLGAGKDTIVGTSALDIVLGGGGDDQVTAAGGIADVVFGNEGNDAIDGGAGFNYLVGGEGNDAITGGDDGNVLLGDTFQYAGLSPLMDLGALRKGATYTSARITPVGDGADTLTGGAGTDVLIGGDGPDLLVPGDGLNFAFGDAFELDPLLFDFRRFVAWDLPRSLLAGTSLANAVRNGVESIFKLVGTGNDTYVGGSGNDVAFGGGGDDSLTGGPSTDFLVGGDGNDTVEGAALDDGDDVFFGGPGDDRISGGGGNDLLESEDGADVFDGGDGDDTVHGGEGADVLRGGAGADFLAGEGSDDVIDGGPGADTLIPGAGDNTIADPDPADAVLDAGVLGRYMFLNGPTTGDHDAAILADKSPLLPGRSFSPANVNPYGSGINGLMIDLLRPPGQPTALSLADFDFRVGTGGDPATWAVAPAPTEFTVRAGSGNGGADHVTLTWADGAIAGQWLRVAVRANARTGLPQEDVFYFGSLPGDANADGRVNFNDLLALAKNYNGTGKAWADGDFTGDGVVNFNDLLVLAKNYNKTVPAIGAAPAPSATIDVQALAAAMGIAVPTTTVTPTKSVPPPARAKKPSVSPKPAPKPTPVVRAVTPAPVAKAPPASVLRDDDKAKPVFSTTRVAKPAPAKPKTVARPKGW